MSFSKAWRWKVKANSLSCVRLFSTPRSAAYQTRPLMGLSRQEYWSWVTFPTQEWHPAQFHSHRQAHSRCLWTHEVRVSQWQWSLASLPYDPAVPLLGIYPEETRTEKDTCAPVLIAALFTMARTWEQISCPSTDEWVKKLWYIYAMEYYSA